MQQLALGIDIGGTNMRLGIVSLEGELVYFAREPINRSFSGDDIVEFLAAKALASNMMQRVGGGGIAVAATISKDGVPIPEFTNFSGLGRYPIGPKLSEALGIPFMVGNDANLALHGEAHFGAARGCTDALLLTLGTGIGSSLLLGAKVRQGAHQRNSEIGETLVYDVQQDRYVAIEKLVSGNALTQRLGSGDGLLFERAKFGDQRAIALVEEMYESLGRLITNVHFLLDLEKVIISGGLADVGDELIIGLQAAVDKICPPALKASLRIEAGGLKPDTAGVIGAACLWYEHQGFLPKY
jgi:glucokinase